MDVGIRINVNIISTQTIKPSSPTLPHFKTYKLSLLDHFHRDGCYPIILFYSPSGSASEDTAITSQRLKKSLAETLTHYYPLAGRVRDGFSVDCDDSGAPFLEAHVASKMSEVLERLEFDVIAQLLPFKADFMKLCADHNVVVVQANYFSCGGVAIGIYFKHAVADGPAATNFIKTWSAIASGRNVNIKDAVFDCASVFPPQDLPVQVLWRRVFEVNFLLGEAMVKRFTFDGTQMAALRGRIGDGATRFVAVTTLILTAAVAAARERNDVKQKNVAFIPVNLRKRMNPSFPEECLGNVGQNAVVKWQVEEMIDYSNLAGKIRDSIRMMDDKYARKVNEGGGFFKELKDLSQELSKMNVYLVSSYCRFPLYEADFGWGKPEWANVLCKYNNFVVISDTSDGQGIEAWVGLPKQDMAMFVKNPDILACASFNPSF